MNTSRTFPTFLFLIYIYAEQDFIPVVDIASEKVVHIDFPPAWKKEVDGSVTLSVTTTEPPTLSEDSFPIANRDRIPPPRTSFDFLSDLMQETDPTYKPRNDLKPLHVIQPEGVSFRMDGHVLEWQKWKMHIGTSSALRNLGSPLTFPFSR